MATSLRALIQRTRKVWFDAYIIACRVEMVGTWREVFQACPLVLLDPDWEGRSENNQLGHFRRRFSSLNTAARRWERHAAELAIEQFGGSRQYLVWVSGKLGTQVGNGEEKSESSSEEAGEAKDELVDGERGAGEEIAAQDEDLMQVDEASDTSADLTEPSDDE